MTPGEAARTIILAADDQPFPVVFEMLATTIMVPAWKHISLVVRGPDTERLTIGYGRNGVSVFRDERLAVDVFDADGTRIDIPGF